MATKLSLDGLPSEIAERARTVFGGVVSDLDQLLKKLGGRFARDSAPTRKELLKLIATLRKSLDARLSALERVVAGAGKPPAAKKRTAKAPAKTRKAAKVTKVTKSAKAPGKTRPAARKTAAKSGGGSR